MPTSYDKLDSLFQDYIYDSIIQVVMRNELREYSAWAFPVLKALEGRTKQILDYNKIRINDKIGFKIREVEILTSIKIYSYLMMENMLLIQV